MTIAVEQTPVQVPVLDAAARRRSVTAAVVGNFVEFYDWTIYAFMVPIIAEQMFPATSPGVALLLAFSSFSLAYVARPVGALLFGVYGDRLGRRNAMMAAILLMAGASLIIGITPSFASIGLAASGLIVFARLLQGIAAGGEAGNATAYLAEIAHPRHRAFTSSFQQLSTGLSSVFAIGVASALSWALTPEQLAAWGWRLAFLLGGVLGLVGLYLRRHAEETPSFRAHEAASHAPLALLMRSWRALLRTIGIALLPSFAFLTWQALLPAYLSGAAGLSRTSSLTVGLIGILCFVAVILPSARLADRVGRKPIMIGFGLASLLLAYPTFVTLPANGPSLSWAIGVAIAGNLILGIMAGSLVAVMTEQFDTKVRVTGTGLAYAVAVVCSGVVFPPLMARAISSGSFDAVWMTLSAVSAISTLIYIAMPETKTRDMVS